jgi:uncharacterized protein (TIGR00251 family)
MGKIKDLIKKHQDGAILNLFVKPGSRLVVFPAGINNWRKCVEIQVSAPAKDNKANKELIKTVADYFEKPINEIFIISGSKKNKKAIFIKGISVDFVSNRLRESLDGL